MSNVKEAMKKLQETRQAKRDRLAGCIKYLGECIEADPGIGQIVPTSAKRDAENKNKSGTCKICPVWRDCTYKR